MDKRRWTKGNRISTGKPTVRGEREEGKRRNRGQVARNLKRKRTKGSGSKGECRSESEGKHLWNGCGSEAGKSERIRTERQVSGTGRKARETRLERRGKAEEPRGTEVHRRKPL